MVNKFKSSYNSINGNIMIFCNIFKRLFRFARVNNADVNFRSNSVIFRDKIISFIKMFGSILFIGVQKKFVTFFNFKVKKQDKNSKLSIINLLRNLLRSFELCPKKIVSQTC